jgi:hypothetical protein
MESKVGKRALGAVLAIGVAAVVLTGCTSATGGAPDPASSDITSEATERQAGETWERIRVCFQNNTSRNLEYSFVGEVVDDQIEYLSSPSGILGTNAFVCAGSRDAWLAPAIVELKYKNSAGKFTYIYLHNETKFVLNVYDYGNPGAKQRDFVDTGLIPSGDPFVVTAGSEVISALITPTLRTFDKLTAYPMDVRIYDAP